MGGDGSVARVWVGVDRRWGGCSGGRRAGWLLVREWVDEWVDRDSGGRLRRGRERVSQREEVARLFVCQPRWDPLPILSHSSLPRPPHPPAPRSSRSTTPAERSAQGRRLRMCPRGSVCARVCMSVCMRARAYVCVYTHVSGTRSRSYVRRTYVLHLTNITSMYSRLPYVPDM